MAQKTINQNPQTTDTILLQFQTPDANGCFFANPYMVNSVFVYYVERSYDSAQFGEFNDPVTPDNLTQSLQAAQALYCSAPTQANLVNLQMVQAQVASATTINTFFYSDATPVLIIGGDPNFPAWLSTDVSQSELINIPTDANGDVQYGMFEYSWMPNGNIRPGDFFMCWTWTPNPDGVTLSDTVQFTIRGNPNACVSIPTHITPPQKYIDLLERYLPEMYKSYISQNDITPETLSSLQTAIAAGFKGVEDQANQLIDLFDANALQESFLVYLGNLFNLKFKSSDPTLWRRQIKEAVPLFKQKGTKFGLKKAFEQAGMVLNSITRLWQIVSSYTYEESFRVGDSLTWRLRKNVVQPIDPNNFQLSIRRQGTTDYVVVSNNSVYFEGDGCGLFTNMTWTAGNPPLPGDIVRVLYSFIAVPPSQQSNENYIQGLPLADLRDEFAQLYPKKNWNVHLIEETDPMFEVLIPVRFPFHDLVVFGKVRTEFPYSENIYNMDEYSGSIRDSLNPCDIDKDFVDPCGSCLSSKFNIDVGIEELSNDRIDELNDVLAENIPFHAFVQSISLSGEVNDYIPAPVETIQCLIMICGEDFVISGMDNPVFTRLMVRGLTTWRVDRDQPANMVVEANDSGLAYNDYVAFVAPLHNLDEIGLKVSSHVLQVLSPSPNAGTYQILPIDGQIAKVVTTVNEPVNPSVFSYILYNINYTTSIATIVQDNMYVLFDDMVNFVDLGVQGLWDEANIPGYSGVWQVVIGGNAYNVYTVLPDGGIVLENATTLPSSSTSVTYTLLTPLNAIVMGTPSTTGFLKVKNIGNIDLNDPAIPDISQYVIVGDWVEYAGTDYPVCGIVGNNIQIGSFFIPYTAGGVGGASIIVKRRLINKGQGYFNYAGLKLTTNVNYEEILGILNGANPPAGDPTDNSMWKENFLIAMPISSEYVGKESVLDETMMYFKIAEIDGVNITLDGLPQQWTTLSAGGTEVDFQVDHFINQPISIEFLTFDQLQRTGKDIIEQEILSDATNNVTISALQHSPGSEVQDMVKTEEGISFQIEWKNGERTQGDIV
jgi:Phage tail protein (Tail_P2_I)